MPVAAALDGASQVDGDTEEGEPFDFDDSDDSGADTSHLAAETSHVVNRKQTESDIQETTPDVNGAAGRQQTGKHSLYHQCSTKAGRQRCIVLLRKIQCAAAGTLMVSSCCVFQGSEVRESPEG